MKISNNTIILVIITDNQAQKKSDTIKKIGYVDRIEKALI